MEKLPTTEDVADGLTEVYDADLKSYFDTINHDNLMKCVERRITDRSVLSLIRMWLQAPVIESDERGRTTGSRPTQGTPQGGVISPLLENIYLHWFERLFHGENGPATFAKAKIVRYADDFVIMARYLGPRITSWVEPLLEGKFKLTINREKTRIVKLRQPGASLDFLGYSFRFDRDLHGSQRSYLNVFPAKKSQAKARERVRELTDKRWCFARVTSMIENVNEFTRGWGNYFSRGYPAKAYRALNGFAVRRLTKHLQRRSQRSYRPPAGKSFYAHLRQLGLRRLGTPSTG